MSLLLFLQHSSLLSLFYILTTLYCPLTRVLPFLLPSLFLLIIFVVLIFLQEPTCCYLLQEASSHQSRKNSLLLLGDLMMYLCVSVLNVFTLLHRIQPWFAVSGFSLCTSWGKGLFLGTSECWVASRWPGTRAVLRNVEMHPHPGTLSRSHPRRDRRGAERG